MAGGNPLMILEAVDVLTERERIAMRVVDGRMVAALAPPREGELPLPATLEELLASRFEALAPEGRMMLRWCALLDTDMSTELVDMLGGDAGSRMRLRLVSDGILVEARDEAQSGERLAFAHPAMARVALASIDPTAVAAMHARVAECLERLAYSRGEGAEALARHREAAGADRPAARAWFEAASAWRGRSRDADALRAYGKVVELCAGAEDGEGAALRFGAHTAREDIARAEGRVMARRSELQAMRALAASTRDPRLVGRALARQARYRDGDLVGGGGRARRGAGGPGGAAERRRAHGGRGAAGDGGAVRG